MAVYKCIYIVQKDLISSYFNTLHLPQPCCVQIRELHNLLSGRGGVVILLDWSGVDLDPQIHSIRREGGGAPGL